MDKIEVAEFWLSESRYLKQVGDSEPQYVVATPGNPVLVRLPAKIMRQRRSTESKLKQPIPGEYDELDHPEDAFLKRVRPLAPVDVRPGKDGPKSAPPAHEAVRAVGSKKKPVVAAEADAPKRAADQ
jgi:hypothetical protein